MTAPLRALVAGLALVGGLAAAQDDGDAEKRLKGLANELRCLVCQNQTIGDSNAPLANDLKREIRTMIATGKSDADIRDYMVARYGDFVLYRPPVTAATAFLWVGPFLIAVAALAVLAYRTRARRRAEDDALPEEDVRRARDLIDGRSP